MTSTLLEVQQLGVAYGDVRAVWDVSFTIQQSEIVVLIGPNGAGKTTIMRTLAGLQQPVAGTIHYEDSIIHDSQHKTPAYALVEQGIILVHEGRRLFGGLSVVDNLEMGAFTPKARVVREQTRQRVFELFPRLAERKDQRAATMSGGEQQMLAIGRAMMGLPRLLLLDEPSLGLAPLVVKNIFEVITLLNQQGITVLLVEQNAKRALSLADRAYVIEQGRVASSGSGEELLKSPVVQQAYLGGQAF
ncbi:MAG: ABC transporter ATP-binding protein [Caldilineaceae bacterium]|nr:ABC transporter ATP-binding protein [Caldilineaceae bacterium]MCB0140658.1 ABC transporter ATP-binding protein [Caldilineaceae bacterium]